MKSPIEVVCPNCLAAIGAKCTERGPGGFGKKFVARFCDARVDKAVSE